MVHLQSTIGLKTELQLDFETVQQRVVEALKTEGFGVLTEINVKDTLKKKIDVDFRPYKILGACNPSLAYRALTAAPDVGLLLPCNVTIAQMDDGRVQVAIVDPLAMMNIIHNEGLTTIAQEARERLNRVLSALEV
ncbi:MAG: DUF302 domain-containing protein [Chloroflexota bacterium]